MYPSLQKGEQMIWFAVIGVSLIVGYLIGFQWAQYLVRPEYKRTYEAQLDRDRSCIALLETANSELRAHIKLLCQLDKAEQEIFDEKTEVPDER